jgi:hypothetical protein
VAEDCAGGLCDAAAHDLAVFLRYRQWASVGIRWGTLGDDGWCDVYYGEGDDCHFDGYHCVCTVRLTDDETWAIDLTPTQFDPSLPFPLFFRIELHGEAREGRPEPWAEVYGPEGGPIDRPHARGPHARGGVR